MTERRKFMRFSTWLDVLYNALGGPTIKMKSRLKDLSKEGIRMSSDMSMEKGSVLELEMKIPGDNIPIFALGEVAWTEKTGNAAYDAGIRFTRIERFDRAKLLDYVYNEWIKTRKDKS